MRLRIILPALLVFLASAANVAFAQPSMTPPGQPAPHYYQPGPSYLYSQPQQTRTVGYGLQVFAADAASWLALGASGSGDSPVAAIGAAGVFLGGPIVHLANGNRAGAGYSLLARVGLPMGGALLFTATCDDSESWDCLGSGIAGLMLGYAGALAIDWFHLAKKTEVIAPPTGWASLRPSVQLRDGGAQAGFSLHF